ncbi:MAG: hypothetical protein A2033_08020 [Bacteroidetes bacterium GWA2_31_9]|nr:MAG: hypothetical protein A2033_08020 [Bacteroidetes bacterium GWA2_31_9]
MKQSLVILVLIFAYLTGKTQVTYFNYLDSTVEWNTYSSGWNGINMVNSYSTTFFDGDTLINGKYYYKRFRLQVDSNFYSQSNIGVDSTLYGLGFIREDNTLKYWNYNISLNIEQVAWDWQEIINLQINDTFSVMSNPCTVNSIDTLFIGSRQLKQFHSSLQFTPNSILEGVGQLGPLCALGIEGNGWTACFKKQGDTLQFSNINCNSFPVPQRHNHFNTLIKNITNDKIIKVFPNPFNDWINITSPYNQEIEKVIIKDMSDRIIIEYKCKSDNIQLNTSMLSQGIFFIFFIGENFNVHHKIIKY